MSSSIRLWGWQNRPLERLYALVLFDAIRVKMRDEAWQ
jgi:transposase-like protein